MKKFSVTLDLNPVTVQVESDSADHDKLIELAKVELLKQLAVKFPKLSFSVSEGELLENPHPGMLVRIKDKSFNEVGIITAVNTKSINLTLKGGRSIRASIGLLSKDYSIKFEDVFTARDEFMQDSWDEGDMGYMVNKNEITPVICCKSGKVNCKFFIVNSGGRFYTLTQSQTKCIYNSFEEAQKKLKIINIERED